MGSEKPNSLIMKWRKWALQISLLIDEFWNSSQAHSRTEDYKPLTTALLENLPQLSCDIHGSKHMFYCSAHSNISSKLTYISSLQG